MPGFDRSILTDVGWDALTDAEAGQHIEYTHLEAGDGYVYGGDAEIFAMTALKNKIMDFPITNFSNDGQGQITLIGVISSKNVTTGFNFREIGVRCTIDGGPSILYAVANAGDEADYIPSSAEAGVVIQTVQIIIKIDRASNVTVIVQPGLDVTAQNIGPGTVGPGWFRDKQGQILWFKRINSPKKTLTLTETSDIVSIDIPVVDQNLDMWVALGNPDIFPNFSTIQKALNYLIPLEIKPGIFVTIHVAAGTWSGYPTILVDHPQGSQIKIIGTIGTVKNVLSASGNASAVTVNAAVGAFNDMAVGDYFFLRMDAIAAQSRVGKALSGIRKVTAKAADGHSITYEPWWYGTFPANIGAIDSGTVTPMKTILEQPVATKSNMHIINNGLGLLKNIVSVGGPPIPDPGGNGMWGLYITLGSARFENVGAYRWQVDASSVPGRSVGIGAWGPCLLICYDCATCECASGFGSSTGAIHNCIACYGNSCDYAAFHLQAGYMNVDDSQVSGNRIGLISAQNATFGWSRLYATFNSEYGMYVVLNSYASGGDSAFAANGVKDIYLGVVSSMIRTNGALTSYGSANLAPYSLSYDGCYFIP